MYKKILIERALRVLLGLVVIFFCLFWLLAKYLVSVEFNIEIDSIITEYFYANRTSLITSFFLQLTKSGSYIATLLVGLIFIILLVTKKMHSYIFPFIFSQIGASLSVTLAKYLIARPRPGLEIAYYLENSYSFPSGHSSNSLVLYGYLAYFIIRNSNTTYVKWLLSFFLITLILLVGISRIYLGVHYFDDVIGGYLVGLMWLFIAIIITEILLKSKDY